MAKELSMTFERDDTAGHACLEYSWVPEGLRRSIQLAPGQQRESRSDQVEDDLSPSHVQVYVATSNGAVSVVNWQFPDGGPGPVAIASARVFLVQHEMKVVGSVTYEDGTSATSEAVLAPGGRPCPTE